MCKAWYAGFSDLLYSKLADAAAAYAITGDYLHFKADLDE